MIIMKNDLMKYGLKIYQNPDFFKYSIDSVLLAEFVLINDRCKNIIDLCTGNAPIPLILSKKFSKNIIGVEIQPKIYDLGVKSVKTNQIKNIKLINMDAKDLPLHYNNFFDIVTCNPPYFKVCSTSIINNISEKSIARHEIKINLEDIFCISEKILKHSGSLCIVHRCDRLIELIDLAHKHHFGLRRIQFVYDNDQAPGCMILVECKLLCKDDLKVMKPIYINKYLEEL